MPTPTTRSPTLTRVTADPTSMTTPDASWPRIEGGGQGRPPWRMATSVWQTPLPATCTTTSVGPGAIGVTSSTVIGASTPTYTAARTRTLLDRDRDATVGARPDGHDALGLGGEGVAGEPRVPLFQCHPRLEAGQVGEI